MRSFEFCAAPRGPRPSSTCPIRLAPRSLALVSAGFRALAKTSPAPTSLALRPRRVSELYPRPAPRRRASHWSRRVSGRWRRPTPRRQASHWFWRVSELYPRPAPRRRASHWSRWVSEIYPRPAPRRRAEWHGWHPRLSPRSATSLARLCGHRVGQGPGPAYGQRQDRCRHDLRRQRRRRAPGQDGRRPRPRVRIAATSLIARRTLTSPKTRTTTSRRADSSGHDFHDQHS